MDKNKVDLQHTHWPRVSNRLYEVEKSAVILKLFLHCDWKSDVKK